MARSDAKNPAEVIEIIDDDEQSNDNAKNFNTLTALFDSINELPRQEDRKRLEFECRKLYDNMRLKTANVNVDAGLEKIKRDIDVAMEQRCQARVLDDKLKTMSMLLLSVEAQQVMQADPAFADDLYQKLGQIHEDIKERTGKKRKSNQLEMVGMIEVEDFVTVKRKRFGETVMKVRAKNAGEEMRRVEVKERNEEGEVTVFELAPGDVVLERRENMDGKEWWYGTWKADEVWVLSEEFEGEKWRRERERFGA